MDLYSRVVVETPVRTITSDWEITNRENLKKLIDSVQTSLVEGVSYFSVVIRNNIVIFPETIFVNSIVSIESKEE